MLFTATERPVVLRALLAVHVNAPSRRWTQRGSLLRSQHPIESQGQGQGIARSHPFALPNYCPKRMLCYPNAARPRLCRSAACPAPQPPPPLALPPAPYYFQHHATFDTPNERHSKKNGARFECFLNGDHGETWISQRQQPPKKDQKRASPPAVAAFFVDPKHHAEVFLNPFGCGILSLTLIRNLPPHPQPWADTLDFAYHLSHIKRRTPILWRVKPDSPALTPPDPDEGAWVQSLQLENRPSLERAATANSPFTLPELFDALLEPIASQLAGTQGQFSIYSVLEFASEADLAHPAFLPALRAMAQLEESAPGHRE